MRIPEVQRKLLKLGRMAHSRFFPEKKRRFRDRLGEYERTWRLSADALGARVHGVAPDVWRVERDGVFVHVRNHQIQLDDPVTLTLAGRKDLMHRFLSEAGLAVPHHRVLDFHEIDQASDFLAAHPEGVVVKPARGSAAGDGVSTHLRSRAELRRAALLASLYDRRILVEEMVPGESYRALVVGGTMVHAVCRRGPRVRGDGATSVRGLLDRYNRGRADPLRLGDPDLSFALSWQGWTLDDTPPEGGVVILKAVDDPEGTGREIRTIYNTTVTDEVCASIRADVEKAAEVLGSDFVGVDLIAPDIGRSLGESGGRINEVNTTPALHHHYDAEREDFPRVAIDVLDLALRRASARGARAGGVRA